MFGALPSVSSIFGLLHQARSRIGIALPCVVCGTHGHGALGSACGLEVVRRAEQRGLLTLGAYDSPLGEKIRRLKFHDETHHAARLGSALAQRHAAALREVVLVPVPLHALRLAERGYNQSSLVARAIGRALGVPTATDALVRTTVTHRQVGLGAEERRQNLDGCFSVTSRGRRLVGKRLALVDDVYTTGSTLAECERTLTEAGLSVAFRVTVAIAE